MQHEADMQNKAFNVVFKPKRSTLKAFKPPNIEHFKIQHRWISVMCPGKSVFPTTPLDKKRLSKPGILTSN